MVLRLLFLFFALFTFYAGASQTEPTSVNLIPNPSFEYANTCNKYKELCCPEAWRSTTLKLFYYLNDMRSKNETNPPFDGHRMISICIHDRRIPKNRTFVQVPLLCPLTAGVEYRLSFYYKAKDQHVGGFGVRFQDRLKISRNNGDFLGLKPDLEVSLPEDLKEMEWVKVEQTFIAEGDEKVMVLGNFTPEDSLKVRPFVIPKKKKKGYDPPQSRTYYMFDQFALYPVDESITCDTAGVRQLIFADNSRHALSVDNDYYLKKEVKVIPEVAVPETESAAPPEETNYKIGGDTLKLSETVQLNNILFSKGKAALLPVAYKTLGSLAKIMRKDTALKLIITGHTDNKGTEDYNERLSLERAMAVKLFLVDQGVGSPRIQTIGKGESAPIDSNETTEGRANNRRVEFELIKE